jgi:hypothetical protein
MCLFRGTGTFRVAGPSGRQVYRRGQADNPKQKNLFISQCYDIFGILGGRKQHRVPNVSISFVSSVDLVLLWRSVVRGKKTSLRSGIARSVPRICLHFDHWNCEPKCDSVNLHWVDLNIKKNNNIDVYSWVVLLAISRKCFTSPNLFSYVCGEFPLPMLWRRRMNFILAVRLGIRTRVGHHMHVAVDVRDIYVAGSLVRTNQCLSQSLWCGENWRIIVQIYTLFRKNRWP